MDDTEDLPTSAEFPEFVAATPSQETTTDTADTSLVDDSTANSLIDEAKEKAKLTSKQGTVEAVARKKKYLVIGGGWGGWGVAKALCESDVDADVTLLDALPDPTGRTPYLSKTGKPVEAGTRGFWKDYPNINKLCHELGLKEDDVFSLYQLVVLFSRGVGSDSTCVFRSETAQTSRPTFPVSVFRASIPTSSLHHLVKYWQRRQLFERIPLQDRASMVGLLLATVDCLGGDENVQRQYDRMTCSMNSSYASVLANGSLKISFDLPYSLVCSNHPKN
jgi:hypothetical protein